MRMGIHSASVRLFIVTFTIYYAHDLCIYRKFDNSVKQLSTNLKNLLMLYYIIPLL